ncbi:Hsp33 family molecular chaperone HslO [Pseudostreptobacillus sp.]
MVLRGISKSLKFEILDTTELVKEVFERVKPNLIYSERIAKMTTLAAILAQDIKSSNTRSSITLKTEGALQSIIAKTSANANVAVKVNIDEEKHNKLLEAIKNDDREEVNKLFSLNDGTLQIMIDYGLKNPYNSIFKIKDNLLELAMNDYYEKSTQTKSILITSVSYDDNTNFSKSSGLLIQLLPNGDEEVFNFILEKLNRLTSITKMLEHNFSLERIAHLIFENDIELFENENKYKGLPYDKLPKIEDIKILDTNEIKFECDCSRSYMGRALINSVSNKELEEMIKEDGNIEIVCSFCGEKYIFNNIEEVLKYE